MGNTDILQTTDIETRADNPYMRITTKNPDQQTVGLMENINNHLRALFSPETKENNHISLPKKAPDLEHIDIEKLVTDRQAFNEFVYTPLSEVQKELDDRHCNSDLGEHIERFLPEKLLSLLKKNKCSLLHRPLITDNYEVLRFMSDSSVANLTPTILEYSSDKFVTRNEWKYFLGRVGFYFGRGRKGGAKIKYLNCVNLMNSDGKKISDVNTLWGQSLIDFHHEIFLKRFPKLSSNIFNGLVWYTHNGGNPQNYYEPFLRLFLNHGVLFENFLLNGEELAFTKKIILPALIKIRKETGIKPLIVELEPTETENDGCWMCHPSDIFDDVMQKHSTSKLNE